MSVSPEKLQDQLHTFPEALSVGSDAPPSVRVATEYIHNHLFDPRLTVGVMREDLDITGSMFSALSGSTTATLPPAIFVTCELWP